MNDMNANRQHPPTATLDDAPKSQRIVTVFDFDGTITRKDTFIEFIRFTKGTPSFLWGLFLFSPLLIGYRLGLYSNGKMKERLFSYFFKGLGYQEFKRLGETFAYEVDRMVYPAARKEIEQRIASYGSEKVLIISASIEEWIRPWAMRQGFGQVIGTQPAVNDRGALTGRFSTPNCHGKEKVHRLLQALPDRADYQLHAFGDSSGDYALLEEADVGVYRAFESK